MSAPENSKPGAEFAVAPDSWFYIFAAFSLAGTRSNRLRTGEEEALVHRRALSDATGLCRELRLPIPTRRT